MPRTPNVLSPLPSAELIWNRNNYFLPRVPKKSGLTTEYPELDIYTLRPTRVYDVHLGWSVAYIAQN